MKKILIVFLLASAVIGCKGPGSGPLVKESFDKKTTGTDAADHGGIVKAEKASVTVIPCDGCITIAELMGNKENYSGKKIRVTGAVTKVNSAIMGKNWIHIQDGTDSKGEFDLVVTTAATSEPGQNVTFEGTISLDKDFGYGYKYAIIMEDAVIVK